ncbi:universal stress protein [Kitasatospora sp. P5_F3]
MTFASTRRPIVLGVDALAPGLLVMAWAADEAERRDLPLRLVHAVPPMLRDIGGVDEARRHEALRKEGSLLLDKGAGFARRRHPDLAVSTGVLDGYPGQALCRESERAELVVLGSRRLSRTEEALSGSSVTVPVSAQAHCPVAVVCDPEHVTQDPQYLVVGVDGSPSSRAAIDFAFETAALRGAALRALWVWRSPLVALQDEHFGLQERRRLLGEATAGHAAAYPDVRLTHEVVRGHPVEELAKASEHALAVVVGRRGRGGFTGMRLGSVPHGLLHHARCPVITVPRPDDH